MDILLVLLMWKKEEGSFLHLCNVLYNTLCMDTKGIDDDLEMIAALAAVFSARIFVAISFWNSVWSGTNM